MINRRIQAKRPMVIAIGFFVDERRQTWTTSSHSNHTSKKKEKQRRPFKATQGTQWDFSLT